MTITIPTPDELNTTIAAVQRALTGGKRLTDDERPNAETLLAVLAFKAARDPDFSRDLRADMFHHAKGAPNFAEPAPAPHWVADGRGGRWSEFGKDVRA